MKEVEGLMFVPLTLGSKLKGRVKKVVLGNTVLDRETQEVTC